MIVPIENYFNRIEFLFLPMDLFFFISFACPTRTMHFSFCFQCMCVGFFFLSIIVIQYMPSLRLLHFDKRLLGKRLISIKNRAKFLASKFNFMMNNLQLSVSGFTICGGPKEKKSQVKRKLRRRREISLA